MNREAHDGLDAPVVEVRGCSLSYGGHRVLEDVTFSIMHGDFLAIIGPNGSGKTTLLRVILGLERPGEGQIRILGRDLDHFKEWWRIGYVPQKAIHIDPIFPISAEEVVGLGRACKKRPPRWLSSDDIDVIHQALSRVGMEGMNKRRLSDLSGGQQQRIFIARAIVNNPDILFLDEPTTGVDVKAQDTFYEMLKELNSQGITIVMVTHDIGVVNRYVTKVACLNRRLVFHGTHDEFCSSSKVRALIPGDNHLILHRH